MTNVSSKFVIGRETKENFLRLVDSSFLGNLRSSHWLKLIKISVGTKRPHGVKPKSHTWLRFKGQ